MNITIFRLQVVSKGGIFVISLDFFLSPSFSPFLFFLFLVFLYFYLIFILVFFAFLLCFCVFVAFFVFFGIFCVFVGFCLLLFSCFLIHFLFIIFEIALPISEVKPQNTHCIERTDWCIGRVVHFVG